MRPDDSPLGLDARRGHGPRPARKPRINQGPVAPSSPSPSTGLNAARRLNEGSNQVRKNITLIASCTTTSIYTRLYFIIKLFSLKTFHRLQAHPHRHSVLVDCIINLYKITTLVYLVKLRIYL